MGLLPFAADSLDLPKLIFQIECALIIVAGLACLLIRLWLERSRVLRHKAEQRLLNMMILAIESKSSLPVKTFPAQYKKLPLLIPVFGKLQELYKDNEYWQAIKKEIGLDYIMPIARKHAFSRNWGKRALAVRFFSLFPGNLDDEVILHLLKDPIPFVRLQIATCAVTSRNARHVNALLNALREESRYSGYGFRSALLKCDRTVADIIYERYVGEQDPVHRMHCLEVLIKFTREEMIPHLLKDIAMEHVDLRVAAVKALSRIKTPASAQKMIELLQDTQWEIRSIAASRLGRMRPPGSLEALKTALRDANWWVRMNAALSLRSFGEAGMSVLMSQTRDDGFAFDISQYVLALPK